MKNKKNRLIPFNDSIDFSTLEAQAPPRDPFTPTSLDSSDRDLYENLEFFDSLEELIYMESMSDAKSTEDRLFYAEEILNVNPDSLTAKIVKETCEATDDVELLERLIQLSEEEAERLDSVVSLLHLDEQDIEEGFFQDEPKLFFELFQLFSLEKSIIQKLIEAKRFSLAALHCLWLLEYDESDFFEANNDLAAILAQLENVDEFERLISFEDEEEIAPLLAAAALYYKIGDQEQFDETVEDLLDLIPDLSKNLERLLEDEDAVFVEQVKRLESGPVNPTPFGDFLDEYFKHSFLYEMPNFILKLQKTAEELDPIPDK